MRSESQPDAEFPGALDDKVGDHPVEPHRGQDQSEHCEARECLIDDDQVPVEPCIGLGNRVHLLDRHVGVDIGDRSPDLVLECRRSRCF